MAETTTLPCADTEEPRDHPKMPEALTAQADHPEDVPGQGTSQMTGAGQADPLADIIKSPRHSTRWFPFWYNQDNIKVIPLHTPKKALCWWNKHQRAKSHSTPTWCCLPRMGPCPWWWRLILVLRWTQQPGAGISSSPIKSLSLGTPSQAPLSPLPTPGSHMMANYSSS